VIGPPDSLPFIIDDPGIRSPTLAGDRSRKPDRLCGSGSGYRWPNFFWTLVVVGHVQHQVLPVGTGDIPELSPLDDGRAVVGVYDPVAHVERYTAPR